MKRFPLAVALTALVGLCGWQAATPRPVFAAEDSQVIADQTAERLQNLDDVKHQLRSYYACTCSCGCYATDMNSQAQKAIDALKARVRRHAPGEKLAMVLDIDETSLSNWEQFSRVDFAYDAKAFTAWEDEARAPALAGTLALYRTARQLGVSVFFLTGRPESERAATGKNLRAAGYDDWQGLILRTPEQARQTAIAFKSGERARLVSAGYKLVLNAGDQWSDLKGDPEAEISIKYPNPFYFIP